MTLLELYCIQSSTWWVLSQFDLPLFFTLAKFDIPLAAACWLCVYFVPPLPLSPSPPLPPAFLLLRCYISSFEIHLVIVSVFCVGTASPRCLAWCILFTRVIAANVWGHRIAFVSLDTPKQPCRSVVPPPPFCGPFGFYFVRDHMAECAWGDSVTMGQSINRSMQGNQLTQPFTIVEMITSRVTITQLNPPNHQRRNECLNEWMH